MRAAIIVAASLLATGAHAQVQSCGMELGRWVCRTTPPAQQANPMAAFERSRQQSYDQQEQFRREQETRRAQSDDGMVANISAAIREGRCDDAKALALNANRLDLADQAVRLCSAR